MLKYIIFREPDGSEAARFALVPVTHKELALEAQNYRHGRTIVAAGFVGFLGADAQTWGRSESLDVGPRPEDVRFLSTFARTAITTETKLPVRSGTIAI